MILFQSLNIAISRLVEMNRKLRLASLWELQSATGEELSALLPSVLDKAFKGEL